MGWRRRRGRSRRALSAAGVHDDPRAFPRLDEALAVVAAVELHHEIVYGADFSEQRGPVGFHFLQQRAAVHDLAARGAHHAAESGDRRGERGNAGGGHAASGRAGLGHGGVAEVADGGGLGHEILRPQFHDVALGQVHLAVAVQVAGFFEMIGERAGEDEGGVFQRGFRHRLGIGCAAGRRIGLRGFGGHCAVIGRELCEVRAEIGGRLAIPHRFVVRALGDVEAGPDHIELVLEAEVHGRMRSERPAGCQAQKTPARSTPVSTARSPMLSFRAMKLTEDIRKSAAERAISEEEALKKGLGEKSREFVEKGAEVYAKA